MFLTSVTARRAKYMGGKCSAEVLGGGFSAPICIQERLLLTSFYFCGVQHHAPIELPLCRNRQWHKEAQQGNPLAHWMARFHHDSQSSVHCNRKAGASMPKTSALRKSFSFQASGQPFKLDSDSQCKRHEPRVCNCRSEHQDNLSLWNLIKGRCSKHPLPRLSDRLPRWYL